MKSLLPPPPPDGQRARVRALGLSLGRFKPGKLNSITDVKGVLVGHTTITEGDAPMARGEGPVRTGVTAIRPNGGNIFEERVVGGGFVLNGAGEVAGLTQVLEWGLIETPILLTNTLSVGSVSDAVVKHMIAENPGIGRMHDVVLPLVGECDDSWLNDIQGSHITAEHVHAAIDNASTGPVAEGNVGGGTGMITCDFAGGIGTSSRRVPGDDEAAPYTVGVLVMSNFGHMRDLRMDGIPVGEILSPRFADHPIRKQNYGSIIAIVATDAPLLPHQINRLCKRVALGIGRAGSHAAHGSGEIVLGFSTGNKVPRERKNMEARVRFLLDPRLNPFYEASIEATEEAILNAICMATGSKGVEDHLVPALPLDDVSHILGHYAIARGIQLA